MKESRLEKIGSAAAGIAHDINNQLNLIVNHLSVPDVEGALQAVDRCSALTVNLLSYCKSDRTEVETLEPANFLHDFVRQLRLPQGVRLELEIPSSLPLIRTSKLGLTRALINLIGNACDAMEFSGTIRIVATPRVIEVCDSGPGMSAECIKQIFEPFYSTKGEEGFGLGLAIVRELMREQGGFVGVNSEPGKGACFALHFREG
jgi:two-component system NtrC family sensor kinase